MTALAPARAVTPPASRAPLPGHASSRLDATVRTASALVLWLGLVLVTSWWTAAGGVQELARWGDGLTSVGRLAGLWSADLLLVQVLLMSRLPPLEHAFGRDRLARVHRVVGFASFDLMLLHVAAILLGYASGRWSALPGTTWALVRDEPGILLSVAGTACLVAVVATSVRAARRVLRYESWHLLHLYAYLGVGLALPHQLWTGTEFLSSPGRTVYWWTLWAGAAGAVLVWRVGLPLVRSLRHGLRVTSVVREASDVVSVHMSGRRLDRLPLRSGQFISARFLDGPGSSRSNPFSVSAAPDGRSIRITAKALGAGSARLASLRPGTRVLFEGPYGRLSSRARTRPRVLLVGAGVGITPIRALAEDLAAAPGDITVLHRYTGEPLFARELTVLAAERGLLLHPLPGPRSHPGAVLGAAAGPDELAALRAWVPDVAERDVFLCGPTAWTDGVERLLHAAGVPRDHLHTESFAW
ncbi:ferredoxin reductase family protein [Microlunatus capsulatus]|uniref:Ferric reductase n=1 Tax=Microlunatus capsulatus TaxID=99117 RepID=A0ABS4Z9L0_9ACTN|nr:ferredoxin reductase family protein [Microlunatus capsulatus]MBP2417465.1 putative ferric reductase [Microlunatus capsulatus]